MKCLNHDCKFCYDHSTSNTINFFKKKYSCCKTYQEFNVLMTNVIIFNNPSPLYAFRTTYNTDNWWWGHTESWKLLVAINQYGMITLDTQEGNADDVPILPCQIILNGLLPINDYNHFIKLVPNNMIVYECTNDYNLINKISYTILPVTCNSGLILLSNSKILSNHHYHQYLNTNFKKYLLGNVIECMIVSRLNNQPATYLYHQVLNILKQIKS